MPLLANGQGQCDRCAQQEQSTSILLFLVVSDLTDTAATEVRYYCRRNRCSTAIRDAGTGPAPVPQTDDTGTASDQTSSDGTITPPSDAATGDADDHA